MKKTLLTIASTAAAFLPGFAQIPLAEEKVIVASERRVNSEENEFSPVFYRDGIVFISSRHESLIYNVKDRNIGGRNIFSIYQSLRDEEGFLQEPAPLADELIFRLHEGPVTFDKTAERIFFTRNEGKEKAPDEFFKLQVYGAQKVDSVWENIQKLPFNNVNYNFCHPSISADNDVLFIASDVPGGYGGMDLYAVYQNDSNWVNMVNLGERVNTPGNEVFPYVATDGTLYFASDGHGGLGGLDLFYTLENRGSETWGTPASLDVPFNSPSDDFGFIVDSENKNGYFSSDRKGGYGDDDIYSFYIEGGKSPLAQAGERLLKGKVMGENGNPLHGATVSALNLDAVTLASGDGGSVTLQPEGDQFALQAGGSQTTTTDEEGNFQLDLGDGDYAVKAAADGYAPAYVLVPRGTNPDDLVFNLKIASGCVMLDGIALAQNRRTPVSGAAVEVADASTGEITKAWSDGAGRFELCIPCGRTFSVQGAKNGSTTAAQEVSTKGVVCSTATRVPVTLYFTGERPVASEPVAGMVIRLPNIYFNYDDAALRPDAYPDLDDVVGMLSAWQGMKVELASHTDARGGDAYNLDLSQRRSASVMRHLTAKGISGSRLEPKGYGESQIRNRCEDGVACSETEHQYNRRTEIKIIEVDGSVTAVKASQPPSDADHADADPPLAAVEEAGEQPDAEKGGQDLVAGESSAETLSAVEEASTPSGSFAVVAGTFANYSFATRRATLLTELGYSEASIVKQASNGLYAVWVKACEAKNEAFALVRKLAQQQLNAYVRER